MPVLPDLTGLATAVEGLLKSKFGDSELTKILRISKATATATIKEQMGELGQSLGYLVAVSGWLRRNEGEWLYDMVWYKLDSGFFVEQAMVLESELNRSLSVQQNDEVDGDFQKLVQARAGIRVWVCSCSNSRLAQQHLSACKRQIERFSETRDGDTYVFLVHDWTGPAVIETYVFGRHTLTSDAHA